MVEICEYKEALLDMNTSVPKLFLSYDTFFINKLEITQWPMINCKVEINENVYTITGTIPQYRFILGSGDGNYIPREISDDEAAKFLPNEIREGKHFFSGKTYKFLENGWHRLKDTKDVRIIIRGSLVIIA
jgi:hypothetical protein